MNTPRRSWFKKVRVSILLSILMVVAIDAFRTRQRVLKWTEPLELVIYPIAAETTPELEAYLAALTEEHFAQLAPFFQREASRYQVYIDPVVTVRLGPRLVELPPAPPADGQVLSVFSFSLRLRYWAYQVLRDEPSTQGVRVFVLYHPATPGSVLEHSYGLPEGLIGVVHAFAGTDAIGSNQVVIAHEVLHTARATDKYDANGQPLDPEGYADPSAEPRWPQSRAELMAGRIPLSASEARIPHDLDEVVVGPATAREIRWIWREGPPSP